MKSLQFRNKKHRILAILMLSILLDFIGVGIVLPLLPFYAQYFQASAFEIGVLMGTYPLLSVIAPVLWGNLSDRIGRRFALIFNIAGTALSYLLLSQANSLGMLFISRILAGASSASVVIAQAYITDLIASKNRAQALSWLEAAVNIGFILGPVTGALLLGSDSANPNFRLPGLVAAIASILTLTITIFKLPRVEKSSPNKPTVTIKNPQPNKLPIATIYRDVKRTLQRPLIAPTMVWIFITMFVSLGTQVVFPLWTEQRFGWGAQEYSYLIVIFALLTASIQIGLTGRLVTWMGERNVVLLSIGSAALGLLLISCSTSVLQFSGALIFSIFAQGTCNPSLTSLMSQLAGAKQQGKTLGLMQSVTALAGFTGATWMGIAFDQFGESWPLWINSGLLMIALIWGWQQVSAAQLSGLGIRRRQQKLQHLFNILDRDQNGTIEPRDFQEASRQLAILKGVAPGSHNSILLENLFLGVGQMIQQLADEDNDGRVDRSEWLKLFERKIDHDFANQFLKLIDTNQDQQISTEEFRLFYEIYGIDTEDIDEIFHTLEFDQGGYLPPNKFIEGFEQFVYSDDIQTAGTWLFGVQLPRQL